MKVKVNNNLIAIFTFIKSDVYYIELDYFLQWCIDYGYYKEFYLNYHIIKDLIFNHNLLYTNKRPEEI